MPAMPRRLLMPVALLFSAALAHAQPRPAVVELFTSEGCSSCPPAEAYVGELAQRRDVLALAFHVDYWDDLGWRDRFALGDAVQRQRNYVRSLHLASAYTPQVVIDGDSDFVGSDRASIAKRLTPERDGVALALTVREGEVFVDLDARARVAASDVLLVFYQRKAVSAIARGENGGRTLTEFNIVRGLRTLGQWDGKTEQFRARLDSFPADTTDVAVLVQPMGQAPIIGAATHSLSQR